MYVVYEILENDFKYLHIHKLKNDPYVESTLKMIGYCTYKNFNRIFIIINTEFNHVSTLMISLIRDFKLINL